MPLISEAKPSKRYKDFSDKRAWNKANEVYFILFASFPCVKFQKVNDLGKFLVVVGVVITVVGALIWSGFGKGWLGRLPGDIHYSKGDFSFHFPIITCLILSVLLTLILWLFRR